MKKTINKSSIIREYFKGGSGFRTLGIKYGYGSTTIWRWVMAEKKKRDSVRSGPEPQIGKGTEKAIPTDVRELQEALRMARLHIELLEATIDIADEQLGTNIRKKAGTRQSRG
jgi:hypothetical protein